MKSTISGVIADILVVDDTPANLQLLSGMLKKWGHRVRPVPGGRLALQAAMNEPPELILLDVNMPDMDGYQVCSELKADPRLAGIPVIFISAITDTIDKVKAFALGGVDYITKPFQFEEVEARVGAHLRIRRLQLEVEGLNRSLESRVRAQVRDISDSQVATIVAMAKLSESRDKGTGNHILRVQRYCRALAKRLAADRSYDRFVDEAFIENIFHASALHDIGKVGIPDGILLKPDKLTPQEFDVMKTHTVIGAETLKAIMESYPRNMFVRIGVQVARSHHERWDGLGYPDGLRGEAIPLAARILALADQFDALRTWRPYKPAYDAERTLAILSQGGEPGSPQRLDPRLLSAFRSITAEFESILEEFR